MPVPEPSLVPLLISLPACSAGLFLVSVRLVPVVASVFIPLGTALWGRRWLAATLLLSVAPLCVIAYAAVAGASAQIEAAARWAISIVCGSFHARMMGIGRMGSSLTRISGRVGGWPGDLLGSLGELLLTARGFIGETKRSLAAERGRTRSLRDLPARLLVLLTEALDRATAMTGSARPEEARPGAGAVKTIWLPSHLILLCFSWALLLAGVYGL